MEIFYTKIEQLIKWIERFLLKKKYPGITVAVICTIAAFVFYFPDYDNMVHDDDIRQIFVDEQIQNPFNKIDYVKYPPHTHWAKRQYRITLPVIGHVFGFTARQILFFQQLFLPLFFFFAFKIFMSIKNDIVSAFLMTIAFSMVYVSKSFLIHYTFFDCYSYLCIIVLLSSKNPVILILFTILNCFTDERGLLAMGLVLIWSFLREDKTLFSLKSLEIKASTLYLTLGIISYVSLRLYLKLFVIGSEIPLSDKTYVGLQTMRDNFNMIPLVLLETLEGFWLPVLITLVLLILKKKYIITLIISGAFSIILLAGLSVHDMLRSVTYVFPIVFIAYYFLTKELKLNEVRNIAFFAMLLCFIIPTYFIADKTDLLSPIFPKILKWL